MTSCAMLTSLINNNFLKVKAVLSNEQQRSLQLGNKQQTLQQGLVISNLKADNTQGCCNRNQAAHQDQRYHSSYHQGLTKLAYKKSD